MAKKLWICGHIFLISNTYVYGSSIGKTIRNMQNSNIKINGDTEKYFNTAICFLDSEISFAKTLTQNTATTSEKIVKYITP